LIAPVNAFTGVFFLRLNRLWVAFSYSSLPGYGLFLYVLLNSPFLFHKRKSYQPVLLLFFFLLLLAFTASYPPSEDFKTQGPGWGGSFILQLPFFYDCGGPTRMHVLDRAAPDFLLYFLERGFLGLLIASGTVTRRSRDLLISCTGSESSGLAVWPKCSEDCLLLYPCYRKVLALSLPTPNDFTSSSFFLSRDGSLSSRLPSFQVNAASG